MRWLTPLAVVATINVSPVTALKPRPLVGDYTHNPVPSNGASVPLGQHHAIQVRGGAGILPEAEQLALCYSAIYTLHALYIQFQPNHMAMFYGATKQVKGSLDDLPYAWAGACQLGAAILMHVAKDTSAERAVALSFLPYLANIISVADYNARHPGSSFDAGFLTLSALLYGGSSAAVLFQGSKNAALLSAYASLAIGIWGTLAPAHNCKFEGPNIDGKATTIALWKGRCIIMGLHGMLATLLLNGMDRHKAIGWFTTVFVVFATVLGHVTSDRKDMGVTNLLAWNSWIVLSAITALGTLWLKQ